MDLKSAYSYVLKKIFHCTTHGMSLLQKVSEKVFIWSLVSKFFVFSFFHLLAQVLGFPYLIGSVRYTPFEAIADRLYLEISNVQFPEVWRTRRRRRKKEQDKQERKEQALKRVTTECTETLALYLCGCWCRFFSREFRHWLTCVVRWQFFKTLLYQIHKKIGTG